MKIALAQINPTIGALVANREKIVEAIQRSRELGAKLVVFPELALCGYPPEDLLLMPSFVEAVSQELNKIMGKTQGITAIVGRVRKNPYKGEKFLYNSAAILAKGELVGFQDKTLLPEYDVFSEKRYFEPASRTDVWSVEGFRVGVTICEDIWQHAGEVIHSEYARDPVLELKEQKPDFLINLSASPFILSRHKTRLKICAAAAKTLNCPIFLCNQVGGNDGLIFDGYSQIVDGQGRLILYAKGFQEELMIYDSEKTYRPCEIGTEPSEELFSALVLGVRDYFHKIGFCKACLGVSGGIDSAVVACIAKEALGEENVLALSLPSRFTPEQSRKDAADVAKNLKIGFEELSIESPFESFLHLLGPHSFGKEISIAEENVQARIRGVLLMAFSNKYNYLVLATGNKSELAMGYSTLYGDMCGGLEVIGDVTKNQVYALAKWINKDKEVIPQSILEKAPSAELRPGQKDIDTLPPYSIVDLVLQDYVEEHLSPEEIALKRDFDLALVKQLVRKIHLTEYKRRQSPPVLRVTKKDFSKGWRFPIVQHWNIN